MLGSVEGGSYWADGRFARVGLTNHFVRGDHGMRKKLGNTV